MSARPQPGDERELIATALRKSAQSYLDCVKSIPEGAAQCRLSQNSWSILEIAEHVAVAEHGMFRAIELGTEKTTAPDYAVDGEITKRGVDRQTKMQAPDRSIPKGRWKSLSEAVDAFEKSRARSLEFVERSEKDPRKVQSVHPLLGPLDGYQYLLLMSAHVERHTAQIEEIKQTPAYRNTAGK